MFPLIELNNINQEVSAHLANNITQLTSEMCTSDIAVWLYVLSDGFVYRYSDIFCVANAQNKVYEIMLFWNNRISIIDTKHTSRTNKSILSQIQIFLHLINEAMTKLTNKDLSHVISLTDRTIAEIKYEITKSFDKRRQS